MTASTDDYFLTIENAFRGHELRVKGSRFIPDIIPVKTKQDVEEALARVRKEFHDAKHHCYAYRLGVTGALLRAADDGEPSGTAGRPILLMLTNARLTDTLLVVTRYFGGTMLGTGGLARAYAESAKQAIAGATIKTVYLTDSLRLTISYEDLAVAERLFLDFDLKPQESLYTDSVDIKMDVRKSITSKFTAALTDTLNGRVTFSPSTAEKPAFE